jgi:soluble cytochrome b562
MSIRRRKLPRKTEKEALVRSRRRCCLCVFINGDLSVKQIQIAHIDRNRNNNNLDNLVALCLNHHDEFDSQRSQSKGITTSEIKHYRHELDKLIYQHDQRLQLPLTGSLEALLPEQPEPVSDLSEEDWLEVKSSELQQKEIPKVTRGYYHSGKRRILFTGFEAEFYRTIVEGLLEQFVILDDIRDSDGSTWRDCERDRNREGFITASIETKVAAFDSLDVDVKEIALKHVLDVLINPSSDYPAFVYDEAPYYLAGEALAVAPLCWLANHAIPFEIEMYQIDRDLDTYSQWRSLAWDTWIRLTNSRFESSVANWMAHPENDSPSFGFADSNNFLPLCPESTNQKAWRWIICEDLAFYLLDVMDCDWQEIWSYELTQYFLPVRK